MPCVSFTRCPWIQWRISSSTCVSEILNFGLVGHSHGIWFCMPLQTWLRWCHTFITLCESTYFLCICVNVIVCITTPCCIFIVFIYLSVYPKFCSLHAQPIVRATYSIFWYLVFICTFLIRNMCCALQNFRRITKKYDEVEILANYFLDCLIEFQSRSIFVSS